MTKPIGDSLWLSQSRRVSEEDPEDSGHLDYNTRVLEFHSELHSSTIVTEGK